MANGDAAVAAGMDKVLPVEDIRMSYDEINLTRDYIAERTSTVTPVAKGGTGSTNPTAAKIALEVAADKIYRPGGDTIETTLVYLGGQTTAATAAAATAQGAANAAMAEAGARVAKGGDTMSGPLRLNSADPVTSGYSVLYRNGDGRLGVTPSALKYKTVRGEYDGSVMELRPVLYTLNGDEAQTLRVGIVADEANDIEPMLVIHENGEVESFKYELLAVALLRDVQRLAARVEELEGRMP